MVATPNNCQKCSFLCNPCKNFILSQFYNICAHFSHASRVSQLNLPHYDSFGLGYLSLLWSANLPNLSKIGVCAYVLPKTVCAHFPHTLNDSHLNLPHTRRSSLGISAVAMAAIFQSYHSYAVSQNIGTLLHASPV